MTTIIDSSNVKVTWSLSTDNGSPITEFKVFVLEIGTTTYTQESTDCVGNDATVIANKECSITISTLLAAPYNMDGGDSVYAKVSAVNFYGESS